MRLYHQIWSVKTSSVAAEQELPLRERVLAARGMGEEERRLFLDSDVMSFPDPFLLPDMDAACDAIMNALNHHQLIMVHGDYDTDGVTATALLTEFLRMAGGLVGWYIPDRFDEGYGLSEIGTRYAIAAGAGLVVTVDCGVSSIDEAEHLKSAGIGLVITDHHQCGEQLPDAIAVVNPHRSDSAYPFFDLCGAAVALKLTQALSRCLGQPDLWRAGLDLAAIGTVGDVMPLKGENRSIVKAGLERMRDSERPGLSALLKLVHLNDQPPTAHTISYRLSPAINAAGRMGDSLSGMECLTAREMERAGEKAALLVEINQQRRMVEQNIFNQINELIVNEPHRLDHQILILEGQDWHPGVLGILAARLSARLLRPVILLSGAKSIAMERSMAEPSESSGEQIDRNQDIFTGSARTFGDFNIYEALRHAQDLLISFGGHRQAAGLMVTRQNLPALRDALDRYVYEHLPDELFPTVPKREYDLAIEQESLRLEEVRGLADLEPFGKANEPPIFYYGLNSAHSVRTIGKDNSHLKFQLRGGDEPIEVVAFGQGEMVARISADTVVEIYGGSSVNRWNGRETLQIIADDLLLPDELEDDLMFQIDLEERLALTEEPTGRAELAEQLDLPESELDITKEALGGVYLFLKSALDDGYGMLQTQVLLARVNFSMRRPLSHFQLRRVLSIYEEAGLIYISKLSNVIICVVLRPVSQKVDLYQTPTYRKLYGEGACVDD
ncbi:MAG: single-stranded-DNA-specific exonuclease RecJ [Fastidiosipilaceae bacterium]|jgi:single-stranded-DNA-specific exonuclease